MIILKKYIIQISKTKFVWNSLRRVIRKFLEKKHLLQLIAGILSNLDVSKFFSDTCDLSCSLEISK